MYNKSLHVSLQYREDANAYKLAMRRMLLHTIVIIYCSFQFCANADSGCGGLIDAEFSPDGVILSPGYPDHYPGSVECLWSIQAPPGERVELLFNDFDMTGSIDCNGDYVAFSSGAQNGGLEKHYCGSVSPPTIQSEGETLKMVMKSNTEGSCRGFNASYQLIKETLTCGSHTKAMEFTLISPNYPESVTNESMQCLLTVSHGCNENMKQREICQMRLEFEEFQIQPPFWGDCKFDSFYVENASPMPILCGNNTGNHMYIDVQGRSKTDLTFLLSNIEHRLYHCYDVFGFLNNTDQSARRLHKREISLVNDETGLDESIILSKYRQDVPITTTNAPVATNTATPTVTTTTKQPETSSTTKLLKVPSTTTTTETTTTTKKSTTLYPTVALFDYHSHSLSQFSTRRAWKIHVTQIPCTCPQDRTPQAPDGCLQYHTVVSGTLKSFNYDSLGCFSEDRSCNIDTIKDETDCDISVGYTGHLNNLDYGICIAPESGFCGIQYKQIGIDGFSLSNRSDLTYLNDQPSAEVGDNSCPADYLWIPGANGETNDGIPGDRFCGTRLGNNVDGVITTNSKPFTIRIVTDADEYKVGMDFMNRGFHLSYSQFPCKVTG